MDFWGPWQALLSGDRDEERRFAMISLPKPEVVLADRNGYIHIRSPPSKASNRDGMVVPDEVPLAQHDYSRDVVDVYDARKIPRGLRPATSRSSESLSLVAPFTCTRVARAISIGAICRPKQL